ncbi:MAG: TonB-dependent receptor [Acidobacteriota bacterium]|nr:TonB-dependent receptor [Acidobacteriota bacterium]
MVSLRKLRVGAVAVCLLAPGAYAGAQTSAPSVVPASGTTPAGQAAPTTAAQEGGTLRGVVKSGAIPLPGVTVTAQNTLTGKRYSTVTDITGAWTLKIPLNGRYVVRTQFAAFAPGAQEALLNETNHEKKLDFSLVLASRAAAEQQEQDEQSNRIAQAIQQLAGNGAQSLNLLNALAGSGDQQTGIAGESGASLPSAAGNSDFSDESVAISGQAGSVSPLAGLDMDRIRDAIETMRMQNGGRGGLMSGLGGFGGPGGFRGMRNFRNFNPSQPHGAIFWSGSNSALNAQPYSLRGQAQEQPASGTNNFGITFISAPYIPGVTKPSGKDHVFLTLSGQRNSNPIDQYGTVPTDSERQGNIPGLSTAITPVPQATALLAYVPGPNLPGTTQNYHLLTTQQSNSTRFGLRYMRSLGANASPFFGFGRGGGRGGQSQALRQSLHFNYNWSHSASDDVNLFPQLGGKTSSDSNSLQTGYTVGYHRVTSIFNANWNRSVAQTTNFFTNGTDIATQIGVLGPSGAALNSSPLNYGLPSVVFSDFTGLNQQQPRFSTQQTLSFSETVSIRASKHNIRVGGDYRRVHNDFLGGPNATGTFTFTGLYTGSSFGDFLSGQPQATSINAAVEKSYLRENVFDWYAQDDWRVRSNLSLVVGIRYEYFAPYTEKTDRLANISTNAQQDFRSLTEVTAQNATNLPRSLVYPYRVAFQPRLGMALRLPHQTVLRGGYGINFTNGQYATFASTMAHQPPFANVQNNSSTIDCPVPAVDCYSLANGFPAPAVIGNYALDPHYRLPMVQEWNVDIQKTLPWGIVINVGYNGSRGNNLDITIAPRASVSSPSTNPTNVLFNYESAAAFSRFNAGTLRLNKRLSGGIALGANYQYSHSIDNAGSVGGTSSVVAQNWQNLQAEEGNSSFDQRHGVSGTYLFELPFGQDKRWLTSGTAAHIFEGFSISGSFKFATGTPITPHYAASITDVGNGTAGTLRPNFAAGVSPTAGGGSATAWFNTAAYVQPVADSFGNAFGNVPRNSITGPGTISNNMSLSKTMSLGGTRSMEIRATASNVFNTVQYSGIDTNLTSPTAGQVISAGSMREFNFNARFRF